VATATPNTADDVLRQMAQIRHDLHKDVRDVVASAEAATDWQRYIRMYPWVALGAAVTVGYLIVPRRHHPRPAVIAAPIDMAQVREVVEKSTDIAPSREKEKGLLGKALGFAWPLAVRAAQGYAAQYLENWIAQQQQMMMAEAPPPAAPPGTSGGPGRPRGTTGH